jgi:pectinesterase
LSKAQVFDIVVSKSLPDASQTIRSAINKIPPGSQEKYLIFVTNGAYEEKIDIASYYTNVCLIGESKDGVIITNGDFSGDGTHTTSSSYTLLAANHDFYCSNITIINSAGDVGQAVAIRTTGNRQAFNNCTFSGFQDTYYAHGGMQYNLNCTIEGATDFIFGDATAVYDSCNLICLKGGQYITAPSDSKFTSTRKDGSTQIHGLLFMNSHISSHTDVPENSYFLGRPWQQYASSVFIQCSLDNHIKDIGWSTWNDNAHLTSFFAEYQNTDTEGNLIDTSLRADWSYQLVDSIKNNYYSLNYFLKKEDTTWNPMPLFSVLGAPTSLTANGYDLTWNEVSNAKGYAIVRNDSVIGFSESTTYKDITATRSIANTYKVKSVSKYGNLSEASNEISVNATAISYPVSKPARLRIDYISQLEVHTNYPSLITIYDISGSLISQSNEKQRIHLINLNKGIYIVKARTENHQTITEKIIIH